MQAVRRGHLQQAPEPTGSGYPSHTPADRQAQSAKVARDRARREVLPLVKASTPKVVTPPQKAGSPPAALQGSGTAIPQLVASHQPFVQMHYPSSFCIYMIDHQ